MVTSWYILDNYDVQLVENTKKKTNKKEYEINLVLITYIIVTPNKKKNRIVIKPTKNRLPLLTGSFFLILSMYV